MLHLLCMSPKYSWFHEHSKNWIHFVSKTCVKMASQKSTKQRSNWQMVAQWRWKVLQNYSTLDKQRICVNTQLKSSKKQLKWNACVPKSNSNNLYAITCDFIAYHLVHFGNKQMPVGYWFFFLLASVQYYSSLLIKYRCPVQYFAGNTMMKEKLCKLYTLECQQGDEICFRYNKIR